MAGDSVREEAPRKTMSPSRKGSAMFLRIVSVLLVVSIFLFKGTVKLFELLIRALEWSLAQLENKTHQEEVCY